MSQAIEYIFFIIPVNNQSMFSKSRMKDRQRLKVGVIGIPAHVKADNLRFKFPFIKLLAQLSIFLQGGNQGQ